MTSPLSGKVAWITGAGSGIGRAGAEALAADGALVVATGRRAEPLAETVALIAKAGGRAEALACDAADAGAMTAAARQIVERHGRLDILLCSAGSNVRNRHWGEVDGPAFKAVIDANLNGAFNAVQAALPAFRRQKDGLAILIASWAGRYDSYLTGPAYNAAKHGLLAMGAHFNIAEARNGLRCCTICPGEVNTPILKQRPIPVPEEETRRMLQVADLAETIRFVARMPAHVCLNEILISPTWNRLAMGQAAG